jgi:hypothetical protein
MSSLLNIPYLWATRTRGCPLQPLPSSGPGFTFSFSTSEKIVEKILPSKMCYGTIGKRDRSINKYKKCMLSLVSKTDFFGKGTPSSMTSLLGTSQEARGQKDDRGSQNAWEQSQGGTTSYGTDTAAWRRSWHGFQEQLPRLPRAAGTASKSSWQGFQEQLVRLPRAAGKASKSSWQGFQEQLARLPRAAGKASKSSWHGFQEQLARLQRAADSGIVLRIWIQDHVPFWPPRSGIRNKCFPGSRISDHKPIFFGEKYYNSLWIGSNVFLYLFKNKIYNN